LLIIFSICLLLVCIAVFVRGNFSVTHFCHSSISAVVPFSLMLDEYAGEVSFVPAYGLFSMLPS